MIDESNPQALMEALIATGYEADHVIQFDDDGWVIRHSLPCRLTGDLFNCPINLAARQLDGPLAPDGRWTVELNSHGELVILGASDG